MQKFILPTNEDEKLIQRRVVDMVKSVQHSGVPHYSGFLNEREKDLAIMALNRQKSENFTFFGGHEGAQREILCVFENENSINFPISVLEISKKGITENTLTHRDYLGAILALGIERTCVGDIETFEDGAFVFLKNSMAAFLQDELKSVGRISVNLSKLQEVPEIAPCVQQEIKVASVASLRLDAVLAAILNLSRTKGALLITQGKVMVNHVLVQQIHFKVDEGDVFSVRGAGKMRLNKILGRTKKNKYRIEYMLYSL